MGTGRMKIGHMLLSSRLSIWQLKREFKFLENLDKHWPLWPRKDWNLKARCNLQCTPAVTCVSPWPPSPTPSPRPLGARLGMPSKLHLALGPPPQVRARVVFLNFVFSVFTLQSDNRGHWASSLLLRGLICATSTTSSSAKGRTEQLTRNLPSEFRESTPDPEMSTAT